MELWQFKQRQSLPRQAKYNHAIDVARKFYDYFDGNVFVSVGGIDSLTLYYFLRKYIDPNIRVASCIDAEPIANQKILRKIPNIINIKPMKTKQKIITEEGFPVGSKSIAKAIRRLQNPTENNLTSRIAHLTGIKYNGEYSNFMKLNEKWYSFIDKNSFIKNIDDVENYFRNIQTLKGITKEEINKQIKKLKILAENKEDLEKIKVSDTCCYYTKEYELNKYAKENGLMPYMGLMASDGGSRKFKIPKTGCNLFERNNARSLPFAIFHKEDVLALALELEVPISEEYGEIIEVGTNEHGEKIYTTTKAKRTGCDICLFGIQLEKRPHRFDRMQRENPKKYDYWVNKMGFGKAMERMGVPYGDYIWDEQISEMVIDLFKKGLSKNQLASKIYKQKKDTDSNEYNKKYYEALVEKILYNYQIEEKK